MQQDGTIAYKGRNDDMMNAGGYRVSPIELETILARYPGITAVAAAAVEVRAGVEVIAAFYTGPAALDEDSLRAYVSQNLARYKQPRLYVHLPELPLGANGKILRRVLRARFESERPA
jgi:acyl-coenzyme A synthetase/AMP-(fatty) acid ligase